MDNPFLPRIGGVLSADIAVPEHEREVRFYSSVLTTGEEPLWREDLMNNLGMPIIGLGERVESYAHLPLQWMPHIQVADVATSAKSAIDLGGSELMHGKDEAGNSQWAVLQDPNGAAFGIIPLVPPDAAPATEVTEPVGHISSLTLTVPDANTTRDFYHQVVGWTVHDVAEKDAEGPYVDHKMVDTGGIQAATIRHTRGANAALPPTWLLHIPVNDLPASLRLVQANDGKIIQTSGRDSSSPTTAVIQDPVGAYMTLVSS